MKKEYEAPKAEKMEFDYEENVVASNSNAKGGKNNDGCYKGSNASHGCPVNDK